MRISQGSLVLSALLTLIPVATAETVIEPVVSTSPTPGVADDPAIWIHPTHRERSVIIGVDKSSGIYVWDMKGVQIQHLPQGTKVNNVDLRYGFDLGGQTVDVVAANLRDAGKLAFFTVNPDYTAGNVLTQIAGAANENNDLQQNSYGFGLYRRPADGALFVFERPDESGGKIRQYRIADDGTGQGVTVSAVRDLDYDGGRAEGFVADDELGFLYVAEENEAIHKYHADPSMGNGAIASFATGDGISGDREGLALYSCTNGTGYLLLSSQGNSTIKIYERQGDNAFVKTIVATDEGGDSGLGTDGLDVSSSSVPPDLASGLLVVHDESGSRYHVYDWADVDGGGLTTCVDGAAPPRPPTNLRVE